MEAREDGIKLGIAQQSGLPVVEDAEEKPESPKGILAELFSFGSGSNTSGDWCPTPRLAYDLAAGELKELQEKLEALQVKIDSHALISAFKAITEFTAAPMCLGGK